MKKKPKEGEEGGGFKLPAGPSKLGLDKLAAAKENHRWEIKVRNPERNKSFRRNRELKEALEDSERKAAEMKVARKRQLEEDREREREEEREKVRLPSHLLPDYLVSSHCLSSPVTASHLFSLPLISSHSLSLSRLLRTRGRSRRRRGRGSSGGR